MMLLARAPDPTADPSPRRWILLGFLTTAMFFCYVHRQALAIAAPFMMKDLGLNNAAIGLLLSAFFWSYSFAQVPAGWLIDRYGIGRVYTIGFAIWTAAVTLTSIPSTIAALIAIQLFLGIGQGVPFTASARAVANWFPAGERGGATGLYLAGNRVGQAAIGAIGPALILAYGWRAFFVIAGLGGTIWLVAWLFSIRLWEPGEATAAQTPTTMHTKLSLRQSLQLLRDRRIAGVFLGYFAYDYVWFLLLRWMPVYLTVERKFGPREVALANSVPFIVAALLIVPAGMAGDIFVRRGWDEVTVRKIFITSGMLMACLIVPAAFVHNNIASAWLLACAACSLGAAGPHSWLLTQAICPKQVVATASGIQNFGGNIGGIIAPAITGLIAHQTGNSALPFSIAGLVLLCGIACYWILIPKTCPVSAGTGSL
jgi:ACS family D-galactonate transporter-like MFS transporter